MLKRSTRPAQHQRRQPGKEHRMVPRPKVVLPTYRGSGKLKSKVALVTGGDSGIGRAVAVYFAKEGANVAITYLDEDRDANETRAFVAKERRKCILLKGDIGQESLCQSMVKETVKKLGRLDILVNNAAEQHPQEDIRKITSEQLER